LPIDWRKFLREFDEERQRRALQLQRQGKSYPELLTLLNLALLYVIAFGRWPIDKQA
jgi:hypothetical protein